MSHVTVVQVHQSHLKTYNEEVLSRRVVETPRDGPHHTQTWSTCHKKESVCLVFHDDLQKCSGSNKGQNSEVLHLHLKDLREQGVDGTAVDTSSATHPEDCELPRIHASRRLVRKSSIIDQNVGVTGTVYMVSEPIISHQSLDSSDDESESSLTSSVSSLSESDSGLGSTIEVGMSPVPHHSTTIAIGEERETEENKVLLHVTPAAKEEDAAHPREEPTQECPREVLSSHTSESEDADDSADTSVVLKWRVIPPSLPVLQQPALLELDGDRGSTPTSFSSAYTVTEHENESTSEDSESSRHNWSGQESDEELQGIPGSTDQHDDPGEPTHNGHEDDSVPWAGESKHSPGAVPTDSATAGYIVENQIIPNITGNAKMAVLTGAVNSRRGSDHRGMLCRVRHASGSSNSSSSGDESIVYSYIPCRDQREKEDEELWVANEAADPGGTQTFQGTTPPLFPPPWGWGGSLDRGSGKPGLAKREVVWAEQRWVSHGCLSSPSCVASVMCTVAPSLAAQVGTTSRKHYSTRQREAESQIIEIVDEEPKYKENWNKLNNNEAQTRSETINLHRSATTNMPTKRFSFLIRSNSVKRESTPIPDTQTVVASVRKPVNPSDQAILDKLATLNIEAPEVSLKPKTKCSLFDPPCTRCGEPVYHQERTEPTLRLVYHSSCFKCHHCGVRLTLKTFFRSPLDSKDTRVFCKSHVPALDPGRLDVNRSDTSSSGKSSPDSAAAETRSDTSRVRG